MKRENSSLRLKPSASVECFCSDPNRMPADTARNPILVLPWNRLPNYLICLVALVYLVAGIVTVWVAIGFAKDITSFDDGVAALFTGLFGLIFIWVAWCFRTGVLPVQFVADAANRGMRVPLGALVERAIRPRRGRATRRPGAPPQEPLALGDPAPRRNVDLRLKPCVRLAGRRRAGLPESHQPPRRAFVVGFRDTAGCTGRTIAVWRPIALS